MKILPFLSLALALLGFCGCSTVSNNVGAGSAAKASLDQMPIPRIRVPPVYPFDLKYQGISGKAEVEFIVDSNGDVRDPRVVYANREAFGQVSLDAILKWKYSPGVKGGRRVNARMRQEFNFDIQDEKK